MAAMAETPPTGQGEPPPLLNLVRHDPAPAEPGRGVVPPTEADLIDYANDALPLARRVEVAAWLADHPDQTLDVFGDLRRRDELRLALALPPPADGQPAAGRERGPEPRVPSPREPGRHARRAHEHALRRARRNPLQRWLMRGGGVLACAGLAWLMTEGPDGPFGIFDSAADAAPPFIDLALDAHDNSRLRQAMRSQLESPRFDAAEIRRATGIELPEVPAGWTVSDVQIYPSPYGPSLEMALYSPGNGFLSLFAVRTGDGSDSGPPEPRAIDGALMASFELDGTSYVLIGRDAPAPLDDEARTLYASLD